MGHHLAGNSVNAVGSRSGAFLVDISSQSLANPDMLLVGKSRFLLPPLAGHLK
jgi:hypothetical protein